MLDKKDLDEWLDDVCYADINSGSFVPSEFALLFLNFIKLVNGSGAETHPTPPLHLVMLDKIQNPHPYILNLVFRGAAKTTLFFEYLTLFLALFGRLPNIGDCNGMIYVSDSIENGVKSARQSVETRYLASDFCREYIPRARFTETELTFYNTDKHPLGVRMYGALSGIRGGKIFSRRPKLAVLDDLIGDSDASSKIVMERIKDTIQNGINYALDPECFKVIMNGTPFCKSDPIIEAAESGGWLVNVFPVAEQFPCERHEFRGAWEERFSYDNLMVKYEFAVRNGRGGSFMQEMMLRINTADNRLLQEEEFRWYRRASVLQNMSQYNFYITTDFATSTRNTADYSVIFVWAHNNNGDWLLVDMVIARQYIDKTIDDLFRLVGMYRPQLTGIETSGQQQAYPRWVMQQMQTRNSWFTLASGDSGEPGIRRSTDKMTNFNLVVPWFKAGKIYFPEELKTSREMGIFLQQLRLVTTQGIKGKDDCLDATNMLAFLKAWRPSAESPLIERDGIWMEDPGTGNTSPLSSYIV